MGLSHERTSKYDAENATEPRVESRGTRNMIQDWRRELASPDQLGAFCQILKQAGLLEVADDLENGKNLLISYCSCDEHSLRCQSLHS